MANDNNNNNKSGTAMRIRKEIYCCGSRQGDNKITTDLSSVRWSPCEPCVKIYCPAKETIIIKKREVGGQERKMIILILIQRREGKGEQRSPQEGDQQLNCSSGTTCTTKHRVERSAIKRWENVIPGKIRQWGRSMFFYVRKRTGIASDWEWADLKEKHHSWPLGSGERVSAQVDFSIKIVKFSKFLH